MAKSDWNPGSPSPCARTGSRSASWGVEAQPAHPGPVFGLLDQAACSARAARTSYCLQAAGFFSPRGFKKFSLFLGHQPPKVPVAEALRSSGQGRDPGSVTPWCLWQASGVAAEAEGGTPPPPTLGLFSPDLVHLCLLSILFEQWF